MEDCLLAGTWVGRHCTRAMSRPRLSRSCVRRKRGKNESDWTCTIHDLRKSMTDQGRLLQSSITATEKLHRRPTQVRHNPAHLLLPRPWPLRNPSMEPTKPSMAPLTYPQPIHNLVRQAQIVRSVKAKGFMDRVWTSTCMNNSLQLYTDWSRYIGPVHPSVVPCQRTSPCRGAPAI